MNRIFKSVAERNQQHLGSVLGNRYYIRTESGRFFKIGFLSVRVGIGKNRPVASLNAKCKRRQILHRYSSSTISDLPSILLQVESLVSNSQTGCSPEMQNYYYWRDRIYQTVLASLQDRFRELLEFLAKGPKALFTIRVWIREMK